MRVDMAKDAAYWQSVAARRGGEEVIFIWKASMSANGCVVMGATPVAIPKRAQLAPVAPEGDDC